MKTRNRTETNLLAALLAAAVAAAGGRALSADPPAAPKPVPPQEDAAPVKRTWLGLVTRELSPDLEAHLGLGDGFGIMVDAVIPGSPAAAAGIREAAVLLKLDDQRLAASAQLAALVRSRKPGERVAIEMMDRGETRTVQVVLGETDMPEEPRWDRPFGFRFQPVPGNRRAWRFEGRYEHPTFDMQRWMESIRDYQERLKKWIDDLQHGGWRPPLPPVPRKPPVPACPPAPQPRGGKPPVKDPNAAPSPAGAQPEIFHSGGVVEVSGPGGQLRIVTDDGRSRCTLRRSDGTVAFEGSYDAARGIAGLPASVRAAIDEMGLRGVEVNAGGIRVAPADVAPSPKQAPDSRESL